MNLGGEKPRGLIYFPPFLLEIFGHPLFTIVLINTPRHSLHAPVV